MNNQWICLGLVVVSYLLGHATGYRLCKLRVKNMLRKKIQEPRPVGTLAAIEVFQKSKVYSSLLSEVIAL